MDKNIGIIGHVDHGSTCLSAALTRALMNAGKVDIIQEEPPEKLFYEPNEFKFSHNLTKEQKSFLRKLEPKKEKKLKPKYMGYRNVFKK